MRSRPANPHQRRMQLTGSQADANAGADGRTTCSRVQRACKSAFDQPGRRLANQSLQSTPIRTAPSHSGPLPATTDTNLLLSSQSTPPRRWRTYVDAACRARRHFVSLAAPFQTGLRQKTRRSRTRVHLILRPGDRTRFALSCVRTPDRSAQHGADTLSPRVVLLVGLVAGVFNGRRVCGGRHRGIRGGHSPAGGDAAVAGDR